MWLRDKLNLTLLRLIQTGLRFVSEFLDRSLNSLLPQWEKTSRPEVANRHQSTRLSFFPPVITDLYQEVELLCHLFTEHFPIFVSPHPSGLLLQVFCYFGSGLHAGICLVSFLHDAFSQRDNCWFCRHKTNLFSLLFRFCNFVVKHFVIFILKRYHTNTILLLSHGCLKHFCSIF